MDKNTITTWFKELQDTICKAIQEADGGAEFKEELWNHQELGGGRTRILQHGNILAKAGVNFSGVGGNLSENIIMALGLKESEFYATGVSIVMHPVSPMVPIIHMNVRYFETPEEYWFGGGIDLTPHYVVDKDARFFHQTLKTVCYQTDPNSIAVIISEETGYISIASRGKVKTNVSVEELERTIRKSIN